MCAPTALLHQHSNPVPCAMLIPSPSCMRWDAALQEGTLTHPLGPSDISLSVCIPLPCWPHSREWALAVLPVTQLQ